MKQFLIILFFISLTSCSKPTKSIQAFSGSTMGTSYSVKLYSMPIENKEKLQKQLDQYLKYINSVYSTYEESSELSILNQFGSEKLSVSDELYSLLKESKAIGIETSGYFDITIGPLVNLWGFGPKAFKSPPSSDSLKKIRELVGMNKFSINDGSVRKADPKVYLDLSAIAKGRGVDLVYNFFESKKYSNFLVEIGGEVRAKGTRDGKNSWKVGIERPKMEQSGQIQSVVQISGAALATSGSYRNFRLSGSKKLSHTINPITLKPTNHNLISVSIVAKSCARADALATAFMAMGEKKAYKLAIENNINAFFIIKNGNDISTKYTKSFEDYLIK